MVTFIRQYVIFSLHGTSYACAFSGVTSGYLFSDAHVGHTVSAIMLFGRLLGIFKRVHKTKMTYQAWENGNCPQMIEPEGVMRMAKDASRNPS